MLVAREDVHGGSNASARFRSMRAKTGRSSRARNQVSRWNRLNWSKKEAGGLDDAGEEIFIRYKGDPSKARYEFIRDYLDFKLKRLK